MTGLWKPEWNIFIFPALGKPPNSYQMTKTRECPSREIDSERKRLCLHSLEATACELACSITFTMGAYFYIFPKRCFIGMITQNVHLLLQLYFHAGFCGKLGWAVAPLHAQPVLFLLLAACVNSSACSLEVSNGDSPRNKKKKKRQQKPMERDSDSPCWILLFLPTEYMRSKNYLALNSEVPQMHGQSDYIILPYCYWHWPKKGQKGRKKEYTK